MIDATTSDLERRIERLETEVKKLLRRLAAVEETAGRAEQAAGQVRNSQDGT